MDEKICPMVKIFTEDMAMDSVSIRKIAGMDNIQTVYTAHSGYTSNSEKAFEMWR
ncbi:MAG: hypothetical protein GF401_13955 [Chitinivibrionales bacterium]|nr:hypothetical protein [Chitinivibrionales bacterium]